MANTKPTIRIETAGIGFVALGAALALLGAVNLFGTMTPVADLNDKIYSALEDARKLPVAKRLAVFGDLRQQQEDALRRKPAEIFGWDRLSYLRFATQGNKKAAFAALRLSDLASPYEPQQLPERAFMWTTFHDVETPEQQAYQEDLWANAYMLNAQDTWEIAKSHNMTKALGDALKHKAPAVYQQWKNEGGS